MKTNGLTAWLGAVVALGGMLLATSRLAATDRAESPPAAPTIELSADGEGRAVFELRGLTANVLQPMANWPAGDKRWAKRFAVFVVLDEVPDGKTSAAKAPASKPPDDVPGGQPAMLGSYRVADGCVRFTPRFPPRPALRYRAFYKATGDRAGQTVTAPVVREFQIPALPKTAATELKVIYPSAAMLPRNQLKFYLHFSAPMGRGAAYEHMQLLDADDQPLELPFLELAEELWDPTGTRLTLLLDPARVKRELAPREAQGPVLEVGRRYTLAIDGGWRDAAGQPLAASVRKRFRVGDDDETPPAPKRWKLSAPQAGSREPLIVQFGESLDHALLGHMLWVIDDDGHVLAGDDVIGDREESWRFVPQQPWQPGSYRLAADSLLEDLAGNSIARKFEMRSARPANRPVEAATVETPFDVEPAPKGSKDGKKM